MPNTIKLKYLTCLKVISQYLSYLRSFFCSLQWGENQHDWSYSTDYLSPELKTELAVLSYCNNLQKDLK